MEKRRRHKHIRQEHNRHGKLVYYYRDGNTRHRLPDDYGSPAFWEAYEKAKAGEPIPHVTDAQKRHYKTREAIENAARCSVRRAKYRAKARNMEFDLTEEWAADQCRRNSHRCALTMIPFEAGGKGKSFMRPFVPSVDRIDNSRGYTPDNVRLVVFAVNMMMAEWGEEVMHRVANGYRYVRNKTGAESRRTLSETRRTYPAKPCVERA